MGRGRQSVRPDPAMSPPAVVTVPDLSGLLVAAALQQAGDHDVALAFARPYAPLAQLRSSGRWVVDAQDPPAGADRYAGDSVVVALRHQGGPDIHDREPRHPLPRMLSEQASMPREEFEEVDRG